MSGHAVSLFDMDPIPVPVKEPGLSAGRRRTQRQAALVDRGYHPLLAALFGEQISTRVHVNAPPDCAPDAPKARPFTCGSCRFRQVIGWNSRTYPKCVFDLWDTTQDAAVTESRTLDSSPRASHGGATDVRAWWPACRDYEMGDSGMSPDASRQTGDPA